MVSGAPNIYDDVGRVAWGLQQPRHGVWPPMIDQVSDSRFCYFEDLVSVERRIIKFI